MTNSAAAPSINHSMPLTRETSVENVLATLPVAGGLETLAKLIQKCSSIADGRIEMDRRHGHHAALQASWSASVDDSTIDGFLQSSNICALSIHFDNGIGETGADSST